MTLRPGRSKRGSERRRRLAELLQGYSRRAPLVQLMPLLHLASLHGMGIGSGHLEPARSGEAGVISRLGRGRPTRDSASPFVLFDVGANAGLYAEMVVRILGEGVLMYCFEPNPEAFESLTGRVGLLPNVRLQNVALGDSPAQAPIYADSAGSVRASLYSQALVMGGVEPARGAIVNVRTLAEFCESNAIDRIDLLKLDIEGGELAALRGAEALLADRRVANVQFEFGYANVASRTFFKDFVDLLGDSYELFRVVPGGLVRLGAYRPHAHELFGAATNYLAMERGR